MTSWLEAEAVEVVPGGPVTAALRAPASKSVTNRALLVAALAPDVSTLHEPLVSDDTAAMADAVTALGAGVETTPAGLLVTGVGGHPAASGRAVDARLSGTTLRFAAAAAALSPTPVTLTGAPPLLRRPVGPLTRALRDLGAQAQDRDGFPPLVVSGGLRGGTVTVDVTASSQYLSAVLLAAPYAQSDVVVTAAGHAADAYIALTADLMTRWGAEVTAAESGRWEVTAGRPYTSRDETVEYDASAAAHLLAVAAATGGSVTVVNAAPETLQPDARIVDVLAAMGCSVAEEEGAVSVQGPERLQAVAVDLAAMPDQVTTVAALAALADGTSVITGVEVTRGHETDRLAALAQELRKLGVAVEEQPAGLTITGGAARGPAALATYNDHRLAMAFAAVALAVPDIIVEDPGCVAKTYPGFWDDLAGAGVTLRPVG